MLNDLSYIAFTNSKHQNIREIWSDELKIKLLMNLVKNIYANVMRTSNL